MHTMPSSKAEEDACMHFLAKCTDATLMASGGSYFNGIFCTPCQYFSKHFYGILHWNLKRVSTFHTLSCTRYSALNFVQGTEGVQVLINALWWSVFAKEEEPGPLIWIHDLFVIHNLIVIHNLFVICTLKGWRGPSAQRMNFESDCIWQKPRCN